MEQLIINPAKMSSQFFELTNLLTTAVAGAIGWFAGTIGKVTQ